MTRQVEAANRRLRRERATWGGLRSLLALVAILLSCGMAAAPASAAIEILNRGIAPDPAVPGGTASITIDVVVDQAPYIVQLDCCDVISPKQTKFIDENQPETQGLRGRHTIEFNVGTGINSFERQITIKVFDSTGAVATQRFEFRQPAVVPPPPPEPVVDPRGPKDTGECPTVVEFGLIQAKQSRGGCWQKLVAGTQGYTDGNVPIAAGAVHYEGTGAFILNGIPFPDAPAGVKYVLAEPVPGSRERGGKFGVNGAINVKLGPVTIINKPLLLTLPNPTVTGEGVLAGFTIPDGLLGGLPIGGAAQVLLRKRAGGFATSFLINVTLPSIFKPSPGEQGSITGATEITTDSTGKVSLDGGKIEVANAAIGKLALKNLCFSYLSANVSTKFAACAPPSLNGAPALECSPPTQQQERFDGALHIGLPTKSGTELAAYGGIAGGKFAYGGGFIDNAAIPLIQGITLERVGFGVCVQPSLTIRGDAGLGFAGGIVRGDVSLQYSELGNGNFFIEAAGFMRVADIPFGNGKVRLTSTGAVDFEVNGVLPLAGGLILLNGGVKGFVIANPFAFNLDGTLSLCLNLGSLIPAQCASASATVSHLGAGGCLKTETFFGTIAFSAFSFYKKPAKGPKFDYGFGCGFQDRIRVQRAIRAQAGQPLVFDVPENNDQYVAHVKGVDAAPKVKVTSPTGKTFASSEGPVTTDQASFIIIESAEDKETSVFLSENAAPGDWKIESLPGGTLTDLEVQAEETKPTVVTADVTKQDNDRIVNMRAFIKKGEKIALAVVGENYQQVVAPNAKGKPCSGGVKAPGHSTGESKCARIKFTPTFGYQGKRTLQATITDESGGTIEVVDLDTFTASPPKRPGKVPEVRIVRKGTDVFAIWGEGTPETERYGAYAVLSDGRKIGQASPDTCFAWKIQNVRRQTSVTLRVTAAREDLEFGPKATVTLKGGATYAGPAKLQRARIPKACPGI